MESGLTGSRGVHARPTATVVSRSATDDAITQVRVMEGAIAKGNRTMCRCVTTNHVVVSIAGLGLVLKEKQF